MANSIEHRRPTGRPDKFLSHFRVGIAALLATLAWVGFSGPALAGGARTIQFSIPAQPLSSGVIEFSRQANIQVLTAGSQLQGVNTPGVNGSFSVTAGIEHLLAGTGFGYHLVGNDTISLIPPPGRRVSLDGPTKAQTGTVAPADEGANAGPAGEDGGVGDNKISEAPLALQEIIVTAQKYSQRAFDVPISLEVISGQELLDHGITNLTNLQYEVPGLYINNTGVQHQVYLRGVTNPLGSGAMVGEYIDEADLTAEGYTGTSGEATGDNGLYDLSRVEVLKGPQGTLYGDGSMGGVIRYITNKPVLDRFQMDADVAALFTEYGAPGQRIETMLNTPLINGTLGLRFAGMFEHDGGWVDEPAASLKNINGGNVADARAEALWQPIAPLSVNAMLIVHRHNFGLGAGEDTNGNYTPLFGTTLTPNGADNSNIYNLTATYDFGDVRVMSASTYFNESESTYNSTNATTIVPIYWLLDPELAFSNEDFSQELRLGHSGSGPWQWTVGAFYKHFRDENSDSAYYYGFPGSSLLSAFKFPGATTRDSSISSAGYANTSYTVLGRLTLGAGVRYFSDRVTRSSLPVPLQSATFNSTDPRFFVQYRVTGHVDTYVSASKGFRSGGFNRPPESPYQPESLWSYDLGAKLRLPTQQLRANADVFYSNYSNFVTTAYMPPFYPEANVGKARIEGLDADLTWQPTDHWRLSLNSEILRTKFITATEVSGYTAGDRLPYAPTYSFTASVARDFRWNDKPGDVEIYYYQISRVQVRPPLSQSDVMHLLSARVGIDWSEYLRLGFFAHNLLNDRGNVNPYDDYGESVRSRPRTFGVEFAVNVK